MGYIQTVTGRITPEELGRTMPHEHIFFDQNSSYFGMPEDPELAAMADAPITLQNRADIHYHIFQSRVNLRQLDTDVAKYELDLYKKAGGGTIVDVTTLGLSPNPAALREVSLATGVNVVHGSGYYYSKSIPAETWQWLTDAKEAEIVDRYIRDFTEGLYGTDVKAGIIGEIAFVDFDCETERKILRCAAMAQKELRAPMCIHSAMDKYKLHLMLDMVEDAGGIMDKLILCHCAPETELTPVYDAVARRGVYLEFDQFSMNFPSIPLYDITLRQAVYRQMELGNIKKLLISQDIAFATHLNSFGGFGYSYIIKRMSEVFKLEGFTAEFDIITLKNPARVLTIDA